MNLKGYRCGNCGAMLPLSRSRQGLVICTCCGSEYKIEGEEVCPFVVHQIPYETEHLACKVYIPREELMYDKAFAVEHALKHMATEIAKGIVPFMDMDYVFDPNPMLYKLQGSVRICHPTRPAEETVGEIFKDVNIKTTDIFRR